LRLNHAM